MTPPALNRLAQESSPYLLQHAANPVNWFPWGKEALELARIEDKPIILSIGYSSCHWCHVMERESFEDADIAQVMNQNFVCIKVDREERPDVDQVYMDAIHAMGVQGGWPLNVFLTPDQKPFYGGTYFPPTHWHSLLQQITSAFQDHRTKLEQSAEQFSQAIIQADKKLGRKSDSPITLDLLKTAFNNLSQEFDTKLGGMGMAPKFPMPSVWHFCLKYYQATGEPQALGQVRKTLQSMALGGIYDHIGGGFARYSVDDRWFAPHFEKMLYDNGQLVSLYSEAYRIDPDPIYQQVIVETVQFLEREFRSAEGGFYSALDADSEGHEGEFYVWTYQELDEILKADLERFRTFFDIKPSGNWERRKNILFLKDRIDNLAQQQNLDSEELLSQLNQFKTQLLKTRDNRVRPGLDDKILTGWNGIMIQGLIDAYWALGDPHYLELALSNAEFLVTHGIKDSVLQRTYKNGEAKIAAYLEDIAWVSLAFTSLYQASLEEKWLLKAEELIMHAFEHYYDQAEGDFYFTSDLADPLIARKKEFFDNVIPSSSSVFCRVLFQLGAILDNERFLQVADRLSAGMTEWVRKHPGSSAYWAAVMTEIVAPRFEIAVVGSMAREVIQQLHSKSKRPAIYLGTRNKSTLPLLTDKTPGSDGQTMIYVCLNKTCRLPVSDVEDALKQLE